MRSPTEKRIKKAERKLLTADAIAIDTHAFQDSAKLCVSTWNARVLSLNCGCVVHSHWSEASITILAWTAKTVLDAGMLLTSEQPPHTRILCDKLTTHTHSMGTHTVLRNARVCQL